MRALLCLALGACVEQYDPVVLVVLPDVPDACATLGAGRARVAIDTIDGEHFEVSSDRCEPRLAGQTVAGFALTIDRVTRGYHRATIAIDGDAGELGAIDRPFAADQPLVVPFGYADLPGWPTAPLSLAPACATTMHLAITPRLASRPALETDLACAPLTIDVARGPARLEARVTGDTCAVAVAETTVVETTIPTDPVTLTFTPTECP